MSKIKISKQLRDILAVNQSIIENLKAAKARGDKLLDKYRALVQEETDRPANRFLDWTKVVEPYTDAVISSKVTDYELQKRYEYFVKQLVEFENQQLVDSEEFESLRYNFDRLLNTLFKLERKIVEIRNRDETTLLRLRLQAIKRNTNSGAEASPSNCSFCGARLDPDLMGVESECPDCAQVPDNLKEKYALRQVIQPVKMTIQSRHAKREEPVIDEEPEEDDEPELEDDLEELEDDLEDDTSEDDSDDTESQTPEMESEEPSTEEPFINELPPKPAPVVPVIPPPKPQVSSKVKEDISKFMDMVSQQVGYKSDIVASAKQRLANLEVELAERKRWTEIQRKANEPKPPSKQVKR